MEYLPSAEYSVDILAKNGEALIVIPRLRKKMKAGISVVGITENHQEIIDYCRRMMDKFRLHGNIGFQFRLDENGVPKILECNPRLQGGVILCTMAGVNMVYNGVKLALGEEITDTQSVVRWGTKMIRYWDETYNMS
jgi:carbamoyl-phosphate synthase large subunit